MRACLERARRRFASCLSVGLALGVGLSLGGGACQLPNPDHCFNISVDPNAWCAEASADGEGQALRPFCSPCAADNQGCVSEEPTRDECPLYTTPAEQTGTGTDTGEGLETSTSG